MRQLRFVLTVTLSLLVWGCLNNASAQTYRNSVGVPPTLVYNSMLQFADQKKYEQIFLSFKVLNPILSHIKGQLSENPAIAIRDAILSGNQNQVRLSIQRMIYVDIKDLLYQAKSEIRQPSGEAKPLAKIARFNYEIISPYIKKTDFKSDQAIKKSFQTSFRLMGAESIYTMEKTSVDIDKIVDIWSDIVTQLDGLHLPLVFKIKE